MKVQIKYEIPSVKELIRRSKELFPENLHAQRDWVRASKFLYDSGKHILLTGHYPTKEA